MSISALLIAGSLELFIRSQQAYRTNERVAQLQETARHALALLELDVRMAGYWGASNRVERIANVAAPPDPVPAEFVGASAAINACGPNWVLDLAQYIAASDDRYSLACAAYNRRAQPDADVLVVRHASNPVTGPPSTPRLRLVANPAEGRLFIAPCTDGGNAACSRSPPPPPDIAGAEIHDLVVNGWYVSRDATGRSGYPSLRRKRLQGGASGASIQDEEIIAGIENLQVQLGTATAGAGVVFSSPDSLPADASQNIVAVRLWLLIRAETPEIGFIDNESREFPIGRQWPPPNDAFRRLLVSSTVYLRNRHP